MKIGVAVLGVGRWGVHFVRNLSQHSQVELVAIADPHPSRLNYCVEQFGIDPNKVTLATEWEAIRELNNLHAIIVATPASTHYDLIYDALSRGYHVLAEKPLTLNPDRCRELTQLAATKQLQLLVDHTYLFNSVVQKGQQVVQSGKLGSLRYGYATRTHLGPVRQDVDALWDLAIHDIAIFNYWLGQTPIKVQARGKVWLQPEQQMNFSSQVGLADLVWLTLFYRDGFEAQIHLCWLNPDKQRRLCIVGSEGTLIFNEMSQETPLTIEQGYFVQENDKFLPQGQNCQVIATEPAEPLAQVCDRFITDILTSTNSNFSGGQIGTELVQILTGLTDSLAQQGEIIALSSFE